MSFGNGPRIVTNGLALSLDAADQNSYISGSTTWNDLSGNGYTGTLQNSPAYSSSYNGGLTFNGSNQYISTSFVATPTYFTFEYATKVNSFGSKNTVYVGKYVQGPNNYWSGVNFSTSTFIFSVNGADTNGLATISTSSVYIVSCTLGATQQKIYVNGVLQNTAATTICTPSGSLNLAMFGILGGYNANGNIYNFRFYNRELSDAEVAQNYNALKSRFNLT